MQPEVIIAGARTDGATHMVAEAQARAKASNVGLLVQPSYDAIVKLNELGAQKKMVAAPIGVTC